MEVVAKIAKQSYLPWEPMVLMPIGDIQYDGPGGAANLNRLKKHLEWGLEKGAYFIGMGDYVDFMSPSNRENYKRAGLYDTSTSTIDRAASQLEDEILEVLLPTKGRWVGLLQGHHYFEHEDHSTSDTRIAAALDAPYIGDCALIRLTFRDKGSSTVLKMWAHHGHGGGALPTSALNKLLPHKIRYPGVRLFMMGHVPQLGHVSTPDLDIPSRGEPILTQEDTHYVTTGGFSRSYQQGSSFEGRPQGGYAEKAMMTPAVLGGAVITLTPEHHKRLNTSYRTVDIKVSS